MSVLVVLIPAALGLGLLGLLAFFWSVRDHQYDDPEGAARRILADDEAPPLPERRRGGPSPAESGSGEGNDPPR